jgi:signal transduction histidine kinase
MKNDPVSKNKIPNILIVDDIPANLKVLCDILKGDGYKVRPVPNGPLALQAAVKENPDLILLDIMMPDMDGYEVCRLLKENKNLCSIPIIYISALNDTNDIVKALTSGGADYITKPFKAEEVKARVATQLKIHNQSKELIELNATKDKFFSILAHDLRGPLGNFMVLTEMMADESQFLTPDETKGFMQDLKNTSRNIYNLLENLLEWSRMQRGQTAFKPKKLALAEVVTDCVKLVDDSARKKIIDIIVDIPIDKEVFADINMLQCVLRNLISNAIKFTRRGGSINLSAKPVDNGLIEIAVKDTGIGIKPEMVENLFRYNTNSSRKGTEDEPSTGLGLLLCKEFVEKHGGKIRVESDPDGKSGETGSTFYFTIQEMKSLEIETES